MITRLILLLTAAFTLSVATGYSATLTINANANYRTGQGGEFTIVPDAGDAVLTGLRNGYNANALVGSGFETFCIEFNENFTPGSQYTYAISSGAVAGGVNLAGNPGGNPDPVSIGTAWLYWQFSNGVLPSYNYVPGAGRQASAGLLQNTIWWLEGEVADPGNTNPFRSAVVGFFGSVGAATANNNNTYAVAALNLTDAQGGRHQDQLVRLSVAVPEGGATAVLLGLALTGIGFIRRKLT
jgi:hypothetical protein